MDNGESFNKVMDDSAKRPLTNEEKFKALSVLTKKQLMDQVVIAESKFVEMQRVLTTAHSRIYDMERERDFTSHKVATLKGVCERLTSLVR